MNGYQVQDAWKKHEAAKAANAGRDTAATLDRVVEFLADRFPHLADDPDAILAVLHCREHGMGASMLPVVRDQLAELRAACRRSTGAARRTATGGVRAESAVAPIASLLKTSAFGVARCERTTRS